MRGEEFEPALHRLDHGARRDGGAGELVEDAVVPRTKLLIFRDSGLRRNEETGIEQRSIKHAFATPVQ
jgi:hypothetical protein